MVTDNCHRACTSIRHQTCFKVFLISLIAGIVLLVNAFPKWMPLRHVFVDKENSTTHSFIPRTTGVPDDFFPYRCQREVMYRVDPLNSSLSNEISVVPTRQTVKCPRVLKPANFSLPFTALLSFPGSGNTWTRHLLQELTGLPTGSVFHDNQLLRNGFPFEGRRQKVIAVKTHGNFFKITKSNIPVSKFERVILVVRNFFDSFLAEMRRMKADHKENAYVNTNTTRWRPKLIYFIERWGRFMRDGLSFHGPLLLIYYEDLKSQLLTQLKRMTLFLNSDHLNQFSLCCALKESEGAYHRKPNHKQRVQDVFNRDDRLLVNGHIERLAKLLNKTRPDVSQRILTYRMPI